MRKHLVVQANKESKIEEQENQNSKLASKMEEDIEHFDDDIQEMQKVVEGL